MITHWDRVLSFLDPIMNGMSYGLISRTPHFDLKAVDRTCDISSVDYLVTSFGWVDSDDHNWRRNDVAGIVSVTASCA
jgi:hypothetical protein